MKDKLKIIIGVLIGIVVLSFLIYWAGITAPKKEVVLEEEMVKDNITNEAVTIYGVYYKWDGVKQQVPWWIIFKEKGEWKVLGTKYLDLTKSPEENRKDAIKFNFEWISLYKFEPQSTRYQAILLLVGFQPFYEDEKTVFSEVLNKNR